MDRSIDEVPTLSPRSTVRWWPAVLIVALAAVGLSLAMLLAVTLVEASLRSFREFPNRVRTSGSLRLEPVNYFFLYQSKILGKLGRYDEAIAASQRGLDLFLEGGTNKEWIYRYEQQIAGWETKKAGD